MINNRRAGAFAAGQAASAVAFKQERTAMAAATAAAFAQVSVAMAQTYLNLLSEPESREPNRFAPIVDWGMRVINDDDVLLDRFSISRATLKRWANGETTPGNLARESVIVRLDYAVREKYGLSFPAGTVVDEEIRLMT